MVLVGIEEAADSARREPGHVLTLLALGTGADAAAVVTDLAITCRDGNDGKALEVRGPAQVEEDTLRHYEGVLLPLLYRTVQALGVEPRPFTLSVTNLNAASAQDRGLTISGYSADTALYVACLSAILGVPVQPGLAATGHIASLHGEVRMVRNLPAKLSAATDSAVVRSVSIPDPDADGSLSTLTPRENAEIGEAVCRGGDWLTIVPARNVTDVLRCAFTESSLILASLQESYFNAPPSTEHGAPGLDVLAGDMLNRYWRCLEDALHGGDAATAEKLLQARVAFHVLRKTYPVGYGDELYRLLSSVPAGARDTCLRFPLLPAQNALEMVWLASPAELDDLRRFLDAIAGDRFHDGTPSLLDEPLVPDGSTSNKHLAALLRTIDPEALYRAVGAPIEAARESFSLESVTARNKRECLAVVTAFHVHMARHYGIQISVSEPRGLESEAVDWLDKAFARQGGRNAAYAEAMRGTRGRMRYVLDALATQKRLEEEDKRRDWAFTKFLDGLEYDQRVEVVKAFKDLLAPYLPDEVRSSSPERYVQHAEVLLRTYADVSGHFKQLVRAM